MRLFCLYSGISYQADTFSNLSTSSIHPIFTLTPKQLRRIAQEHRKQRLTKQESRLLALALWHSTGLVTFKEPCVATPQALQVQESNVSKAIPLLLDFHTFLESRNSYQRGLAHFPHVIIDSNNSYDLSLIHESCRLWQDCIMEYHSSYHAARDSMIEAEKQNFLSHISAFSTRKPARYIKAIANYIIDSLPASSFSTRAARDHARYIISYAGIVHTIETRPVEPITKQEIESLIDLIIEHFDLDNPHIWKGYKVLEQFLASGHYSSYGISMLAGNTEDDTEKEKRRAAIIASLGERPQSFLAGIAYDAQVIKLLAEGPSMSTSDSAIATANTETNSK